MRKNLRKSGIDAIGDVTWGTHICQFYRTKADLLDILIPYFKAGLESNEFCLWIISEPLEIEDAKEALRKSIPGIDTYLEKGQIEIIPYTAWFTTEGVFDSGKVSSSRVEKLNRALDSGYDGMRLSGNTSWLQKESWGSFIEFKEQTDKAMGCYQLINLCTYPLDKHNAAEIIDVVMNHQFALIKRDGKWKRMESSKRKQAEETAVQATKNWEQTLDIVPDPIAILDNKYRILRANRVMAARLRMTPEECVGLTCYNIVHRTNEPPSFCPHSQLIKDGLEHTREVHEDSLGGDFIVSVSPLHDSEGKLTGCIHVARDITKRKQAEDALRESEKRERAHSEELAAVLDAVPVAVFIARDPQVLKITGNRLSYEWLQLPAGTNFSKSAPEGERPETFKLFKDGMELLPADMPSQMAAAGIEVNDCELDIVSDNGKIRHVLGNARPLRDEQGNLRGSISAFIDITERKKAEEALRFSSMYNRSLIEASLDPLVTIGLDGKITDVNWATEEVTGYSRDELIGTDFSDYFTEPEKASAGYQQVFINGKVLDYPLEIQHKDGHTTPVLYNASVYSDENSEVVGVFAAARDITESKKAEEALKKARENLEEKIKARTAELEEANKSLKESEKGLAEAQRMAHIGNWDRNLVTGEVHWSDEMYRIYGRNPLEPAPTYDEFLNYVHPGDRGYVDNALKRALNGEPYSIEFRIVSADGKERMAYAQAEVIFDEKKNPVRVTGIVQDITERKKAEQALELSEKRYRIIAEQTGQLVYDYDIKENSTDWIGNIEELTEFTPDEFRSMNLNFWLSRIHPEDLKRYLENYDRYIRSGETYKTEYRFRKKNEEYMYIEDNGVCLRDNKGNVNRILGVIKDITDRKKAEIFVANIETARKKEIHHRIKNNLQVISSLLDLQSEKFRNRECVEDSEVLKAFRESQDRVTSIALIHEELHEGRGADTLNFSPYLERLVKNLFQTYRLGNANTGLNIELEEHIFFDMDIAVPLGIIINELVSNSLKYAFSGKEKGEIQIKLHRERSAEYSDIRLRNTSGSGSGNGLDSGLRSRKEGYNGTNFILTVSDNGIGIPENFKSENSNSLGLQLVMILVEQLGGELELKNRSGTEFTIRFTVKEKKHQALA